MHNRKIILRWLPLAIVCFAQASMASDVALSDVARDAGPIIIGYVETTTLDPTVVPSQAMDGLASIRAGAEVQRTFRAGRESLNNGEHIVVCSAKPLASGKKYLFFLDEPSKTSSCFAARASFSTKTVRLDQQDEDVLVVDDDSAKAFPPSMKFYQSRYDMLPRDLSMTTTQKNEGLVVLNSYVKLMDVIAWLETNGYLRKSVH